MNPLHASIALGPAAIYFVLLGLMNLSRRPFVTSGMRDTAALGVAISGFMIAGPMELFLPESLAYATGRGWLVWLLLIVFYALTVTLLVLLQRPRIVIYNVTPEQLRPVLADLVRRLDKDGRMIGDAVFFPNLGVHLNVEPLPILKNVQLKSAGASQSYQGWREVELALQTGLRESRGSANPNGYTLVFIGAIMLGLIGYWMGTRGEQIAEAWQEMMRIPPE
jgi:hypothetical protein